MLLFVTMHLGHYDSVMEHIEKAVNHILNCVCHIDPSFSHSQYNLTINQARQLLKQNTPSPDWDSDNGKLVEIFNIITPVYNRDKGVIQASSSVIHPLLCGRFIVTL